MKKAHGIIITDLVTKEQILKAIDKLEIKNFKVHESYVVPEVTVFCGNKKWRLLKFELDLNKVYI